MKRLCALFGLAALLFAVPACNRTILDIKKEFPISSQGKHTITVNAVGHDQVIKVEVLATGAPVNVYVYLDKDQAEAEKAIEMQKRSDKILKEELQKDNIKFEVPIPANHEAFVLIGGASKKANVTVTLKN